MKIKILCLLLLAFLQAEALTTAEYRQWRMDVTNFLRTNIDLDAKEPREITPQEVNVNGPNKTNASTVIVPTVQDDNPEVKPYTPSVADENFHVTLPFKVAAFETPETREKNSISAQAAALFQSKAYDKLEALAAKYRSSKERYADGKWKLNSFYDGLNFPEYASDSQFTSQIETLRDWIKVHPESITARVALADVLHVYAWKARGHGFAEEVPQAGQHLYNDRLRQAAEVLAEAKDLKEKCPRFWTELMRVGLGLGISRSRFDAVFNEAIDFEPEYVGYYYTRACYLRPEWHGEVGEWEKDLARSADKIAGEKGDILYAQVVWWFNDDDDGILKENNLSWARINKGFDAIQKQFPDSFAAKSEHAHLALLADDKPTAKKYFDQTQGKVDLSVWHSVDLYKAFGSDIYPQK